MESVRFAAAYVDAYTPATSATSGLLTNTCGLVMSSFALVASAWESVATPAALCTTALSTSVMKGAMIAAEVTAAATSTAHTAASGGRGASTTSTRASSSCMYFSLPSTRSKAGGGGCGCGAAVAVLRAHCSLVVVSGATTAHPAVFVVHPASTIADEQEAGGEYLPRVQGIRVSLPTLPCVRMAYVAQYARSLETRRQQPVVTRKRKRHDHRVQFLLLSSP
ncbi:hypothetical protein NFJ02_03g100380 [Pycnococcus provasolii]